MTEICLICQVFSLKTSHKVVNHLYDFESRVERFFFHLVVSTHMDSSDHPFRYSNWCDLGV